jgi:hypothetical protein
VRRLSRVRLRHNRVRVRLNPFQTANVLLFADSDCVVRQLAELQYGAGSVLSWTRVGEQ